MSKPISEFIHIEHIGRETLSANPYDEIWIRRIQIEEDKAYSEQHAKSFKTALVFLGKGGWHCDVGFGAKQPIRDGLAECDDGSLSINFHFGGYDFKRKFD